MNKIKIALSIILLASGTAQASSFVSFVSHQNGSFTPEKVECSDPITREELVLMIKNNEDYSNACTREIWDFSMLFAHKTVNYDITKWDVSQGTNFTLTFLYSTDFNQNLDSWDVSSGKSFLGTFTGTSFNQDISNWDVSNGIDFESMFEESPFNQDIGNWNTSSGKVFDYMFYKASNFDQDLSGWDTTNAERWLGFNDSSPISNANIPIIFR